MAACSNNLKYHMIIVQTYTLMAAICSEDGPLLGISFFADGTSPGTKL